MSGLIFDIKDFALNDGAGIRTTVFFKGCPLRCIWCHNPEGLSPIPELYEKKVGCLSCGLCRKGCSHPDCQPFGRCLHVCPMNLLSVVGQRWEAEALAERLLRRQDVFSATGGGVTLSGGEPLLQADFALELLSLLEGKLHRAIETSGYTPRMTFERVLDSCEFVYMDLKLADGEAHRRYTGVDNRQILETAQLLKRSGVPHRFRIPLIPAITDTEENLRALSAFIGEDEVELLSYNRLAPAKYESVGRRFTDQIDGDRALNAPLSLFHNAILRK